MTEKIFLRMLGEVQKNYPNELTNLIHEWRQDGIREYKQKVKDVLDKANNGYNQQLIYNLKKELGLDKVRE